MCNSWTNKLHGTVACSAVVVYNSQVSDFGLILADITPWKTCWIKPLPWKMNLMITNGYSNMTHSGIVNSFLITYLYLLHLLTCIGFT